MKNFVIAKHFSINADLQVYLLSISENNRHGNRKLIPQTQVDEISQYRTKLDVDKRMLARTFLYEYLQTYWGIHNFELGFTQYKKPFLKAAPDIHFSFSYANDYLLVGISRYRKLGADIENINFSLNIDELASEIMCPAELKRFNSYPSTSSDQFYYFFGLFSAKESIIKCFGTGLYFNVKNLSISDKAEYCYLGSKYTYNELGLWMNNYVLSLCYESDCNSMTHRWWDDCPGKNCVF